MDFEFSKHNNVAEGTEGVQHILGYGPLSARDKSVLLVIHESSKTAPVAKMFWPT